MTSSPAKLVRHYGAVLRTETSIPLLRLVIAVSVTCCSTSACGGDDAAPAPEDKLRPGLDGLNGRGTATLDPTERDGGAQSSASSADASAGGGASSVGNTDGNGSAGGDSGAGVVDAGAADGGPAALADAGFVPSREAFIGNWVLYRQLAPCTPPIEFTCTAIDDMAPGYCQQDRTFMFTADDVDDPTAWIMRETTWPRPDLNTAHWEGDATLVSNEFGLDGILTQEMRCTPRDDNTLFCERVQRMTPSSEPRCWALKAERQ